MILIGLEWTSLLAGIGLLTITEIYKSFIWLGVVLICVSFALRAVRKRQLVPQTGLEIPWLLFIGSAVLATWIAYDRSLAFLQFTRILAATVLFYAVCDSLPSTLRWLCAGFLLASVLLAVYWPLQHDFSLNPSKFAAITEVGLWLSSRLPEFKFEALTGPSIHPNVAAGTLAVAIPFSVALAYDRLKVRQSFQAFLTGLATLVIMAGLLMTGSRGAWLGLGVAGGLAVLAWMQRQWLDTPQSKTAFWGVFTVLAAFAILLVIATGNLDRLVGQIPDPTGTIQSRPELWKQGMTLVRDYPFTGSGLMSFWMVHSTYAVLVEVPVVHHAHNTFLEVWIEQGLLGFISLALALSAVTIWAWRALDRQDVSPLGWAGLVSLVVVAMQGTFDVVFYIERTLPLIGLTLGFAWFAAGPISSHQNHSVMSSTLRRWVIAGGTAILIAGVFLFRQPLASKWYANAGAASQAYQELGIYVPAEAATMSLDQVRRSINLNEALTSFNQALTLQRGNLTSLQRLSQIALSRGQYSQALEYMRTAWNLGYQDDLTLLLYGDALVANGLSAQAAAVVRGVNGAESHMMSKAWARYWLQGDYERAAFAWQAVLLLNPDNQNAAGWLEKAQSELNP